MDDSFSGGPSSRNALRDALANGSEAEIGSALPDAVVLVATVETPKGTAPVIATSADGERMLCVFTASDSARAWGGISNVAALRAADVPGMALRQQVDVVMFDPAGPHPYRVSPQRLSQTVDQLEPADDGSLRDRTPLQVRGLDSAPEGLLPALREIATPPQVQVWVFERKGTSGPLLSVGVAHGDDRFVQHLVSVLARTPGLPPVDVLILDDALVANMKQQIPRARVR